jgi:hypothetical protein
MEVILSSETSVHILNTGRYVLEVGNITTAEYLKSYVVLYYLGTVTTY